MKNNNKNKINILLVYIQIIFTILSLIFGVWYFFNNRMIIYLGFVCSATLLIMGYNNYKMFNNKKFSIVYFVVGLLILIYNILKMMGVL